MLIVAEGLKDSFLAAAGLTGEVIATFSATLLERKRCKHPFYDRDSMILLGEHVTLEAGTGCVHTAPGHGQEDYELALKEGLEVYNPVDNYGKYLSTVEFFGGQQVFAANQSVIDKLTETGALLQTSKISHSYPHCWRCKKPIIFRATEQWFISMKANDLREKALEAIDQVQWIPKWGRERIYGMVENRPDWCVSRQRSWGVPITAFSCTACGEYVADGDDHGPCGRHLQRAQFRCLVRLERRTAAAGRYKMPELRGGGLREGERYPGCVVRLGCLPCRRTGAEPEAFLTGRHVSGGERPASRLVPLLAAGERRLARSRPLQGRI